MNAEKLNQWLALLANLGVLAGIVFLVVELQQANRIALRDSRAEITLASMDTNNAFLESEELAELKYKLQSASPELTGAERVQGRSIVENQLNLWTLVNISAETELLPENVEQTWTNIATAFLSKHPGMVPFFEEVYEDNGITQGEFSSIMDVPLKAINESKQ